jgi:hypothetical protein
VIWRISAREQAAPVGLLGKFTTTHLVRGVIAASRSAARSLNWLFSGHDTGTGRAPASAAWSA